MIRFLLLLTSIMLGPHALASEPDLERAHQRLTEADRRFESALEGRAKGNSSATDDFLAAARAYESVAAMGFQNHALLADAGNAYLLAGDLGRAVLAFRRADLLAPNDRAVRDGLAQARSMIQVAVKKDRRNRTTDALLAWRPFVSRNAMLVAGLTLYAGAWAVAIARVFSHRHVPGWFGVSCAVLAGAAGLVLVLDRRHNDGRSSGVVIADGVTARNGPSGAVYAPTFTTPLRAGVELRIIELRDGWYQVELADRRRTWLPAPAIEPIEPWSSSAM